MQRKDEILAKKAKLAELRRQREERQKEFAKRDSASITPDLYSPTPSRSNDPQELERILQELIPERPNSAGPRNRDSYSPSARSRPSSTIGSSKLGFEYADGEAGTATGTSQYQAASTCTQTLSTAPVTTIYEVAPARKIDVPTYNKAIQTSEPWPPHRRDRSSDRFPDSDSDQIVRSPRASKRLSRREREKEEELRQKLRREIEEELKAVKDPVSESIAAPAGPNFPTRALTEEELKAVTSSDDFLDFVERSTKVIERALDEDYDLLVNYAIDGLEDVGNDDDVGIREIIQFYDQRWCKKRMISDLGFSPKFPELLLASYTKNPSAPQDPSGLLLIWNMHLHSRPEYIFHSTSDILTAKFSPFHPSLIIGGSYSGQVLLWDTRSKSPLPVQKTPLAGASTGGHTHPVYSMSHVGTQNANNIISCSTDGVVCGWTVDMLSQPQEYTELTAPPPSKTEDLSPTCMSFPSSDPTSFLVGTEEGTIYPCHRYDRAGAKAGVDARVRYSGHSAPVMSLDFHPGRGPVDLGDLLLSSGLDWCVKLWKTRPPSSTTVAPAPFSSSSSTTTKYNSSATEQVIEPLLEFPREDLVYDARWSPHKPGVFSLVDGAGRVEIWDITTNTEIPVASATPEINRKYAEEASYLAKSLSRVVWEEKEGKRLAVGGMAGVASVFEVKGQYAKEGVKGEEWASVKRLLGRLEVGRRG